jgi:hypothetical protein
MRDHLTPTGALFLAMTCKEARDAYAADAQLAARPRSSAARFIADDYAHLILVDDNFDGGDPELRLDAPALDWSEKMYLHVLVGLPRSLALVRTMFECGWEIPGLCFFASYATLENFDYFYCLSTTMPDPEGLLRNTLKKCFESTMDALFADNVAVLVYLTEREARHPMHWQKWKGTAVAHNALECLKFIHTKDALWSWFTNDELQHARLRVLEWIHCLGKPRVITADIVYLAISIDNIDMLVFALEYGYLDEDISPGAIMIAVVNVSALKCITYLRTMGYSWGRAMITKYNIRNERAIDYCLLNGCPITTDKIDLFELCHYFSVRQRNNSARILLRRLNVDDPTRFFCDCDMIPNIFASSKKVIAYLCEVLQEK